MATYQVQLRRTTVTYATVTVEAPNRYEAADLAEAKAAVDDTLWEAPDSTVAVGYVDRGQP